MDALVEEIERLRGSGLNTIRQELIPCYEVSDPARLCKAPVVSVLMITYNHAQYLRRAVESVVAQCADFEFELIIGEDCSTDETRHIAFACQRDYPYLIRVLWSESNVGSSKNAMRCRERCRGEFIAICEGDDFWCHPEKLQRQVHFFRDNPRVGFLHSDANRLDVRTGTLAERIQKEHEKEICRSTNPVRDLIERRWWAISCTIMVRRELLMSLYRELPELYCRQRPLGDTLAWVGCAARMNCGYQNDVSGTYVLAPDSASRPADARKQVLFYGACLEAHLQLNDCFNASDVRTYATVADIFSNAMLPAAYRAGLADLVARIRHYRAGLGLKDDIRNRLLYTGAALRLPYGVVWAGMRAGSAVKRVLRKRSKMS